MQFTTIEFLLFFLLILFIFFILPHRFRIFFLLIASYYFYLSWDVKYVLILLGSTVITYACGLWIGAAGSTRAKKLYVFLCIAANLLILMLFKYYIFITDSITQFLSLFTLRISIPVFRFLLPIGISIYTLKAIGYIIDVYRGKIESEKSFIYYALFVSIFPELIAGPIDRSTNLLPQLKTEQSFDYDRVASGLDLIAWGYFKKLVIADRIGVFVDTVYNNVQAYTGIPLIIATILYALQVYCDFSGYSDIAIGSGKVLGFRFINNFDNPFHATTIRDLWRRWHISLSNWFRDYFYISIGGSRVSALRKYANLFITFVMSGLWHGASWTMVVWGGLNGIFLIISHMLHDVREKIAEVTGYAKLKRIRRLIQVVLVFLMFDFAVLFFRANTINDALYIITHLFSGVGAQLGELSFLFSLGLNAFDFSVLLIAVVIMEAVQVLQMQGSVRERIDRLPLIVRWSLYYCLIMSILLLKMPESDRFIYFRF